MEITLIEYLPTPGQGQVGIATINFNNMVHLRFKVKNKKDTVGYYVIPGSYKYTNLSGKDDYIDCFVIDSNFAMKRVEELVKNAIVHCTEMPF